MTYVSRKTRIIVARWTDECDAEYTIRACRRRSDGRLKRHASCDDLRAWANNSCINNEHMLDLMSDGEVLGKPPFRLYGRFIPVPILFKLLEKTKIDNEGGGGNFCTCEDRGVRSSRSDTRNWCNCLGKASSKSVQVKHSGSESGSRNSKVESKLSFTRLEWEKNLLEKRLCECTCLLNKAVGQLERIDNIIGVTCSESDNTEHAENFRNEQIQNAFQLSKPKCTCPSRGSNSPRLSQSRSYVKKLRESAKCAELMRKISGLRQKLKKVQDCRQEISQQIRMSRMRAENCASASQVTELYSRREQAHIKRLQKKLEKLITERGKLLSEMCQALACLNGVKKSSRSSMSFGKKRSRTSRNSEDFHNDKPPGCSCGCTFSEYNESTDSEAVRCSDSSSGESGMNRGYTKCADLEIDYRNDLEGHAGQINCDEFFGNDSSDSEQCFGHEGSVTRTAEDQRRKSQHSDYARVPTPGPSKPKAIKCQKQDGSSPDEKSVEKSSSKTTKKATVKFLCLEPSCARKLNSDDLSAYEESLNPAQQALILGAIKNIQNRRPTTSPITKRERDALAAEHGPCGHNAHRSPHRDSIPERQIKSETTMKEIEKTLRNYEQRLNQLGSLECKVEDLKQKSSEVDWFRHCMGRLKAELRRQKAVERERSGREITKLCSENWELRRQVQELLGKLEAQCKRVQSMKSAMVKARELECEAEELKKELSKYRDSFEHQRKCMSKWESVVAVQRTEIENLMNHIRKLTTMRGEAASSPYEARKSVQRSRSYSPDIKTRGPSATRAKPFPRAFGMSSSEEDAVCCCEQCLQGESRRKAHQGGFFPPARGLEWCT